MRRRAAATIVMLIAAVILTLPIRAQQKPLTQEQVSNMARAGLGDESGTKLIERRGIDFAPAEDFLQSLKGAAVHGPRVRDSAFGMTRLDCRRAGWDGRQGEQVHSESRRRATTSAFPGQG